MIDALEAERSAQREKAAPAEAGFACEPAADPAERAHPPQAADEPTP